MGATTKNGTASGKFLDFLMSDESVRIYTDANGAPPATKTALSASSLYGPGKQLQLLGDQLSKACGPEEQITDAVCQRHPACDRRLPHRDGSVAESKAAIYGGKDAKEA